MTPFNKISIDRYTRNKIRKLYFRNIEMKYIVNDLKLGESVIRRVINENKFKYKKERYVRYLLFHSIKYNISLSKMAKKTNMNESLLRRIHKKYNMKFSKRRASKVNTNYNESFFKKINNNEKAYILGLIMTDGYIISDYNGFGIQLTEKDGYLLKKIRDLIGGVNKITRINCDNKRKILKNTRDMARLSIFNKSIAYDLKQLGVIKNKTKKIRYNGCVPKKYFSSFCRGLLDGDGSIGVSKKGYIWSYLLSSSSYKFIIDIQKHIPLNTKISRHSKCLDHWILWIIGGEKGRKKIS